MSFSGGSGSRVLGLLCLLGFRLLGGLRFFRWWLGAYIGVLGWGLRVFQSFFRTSAGTKGRHPVKGQTLNPKPSM